MMDHGGKAKDETDIKYMSERVQVYIYIYSQFLIVKLKSCSDFASFRNVRYQICRLTNTYIEKNVMLKVSAASVVSITSPPDMDFRM